LEGAFGVLFQAKVEFNGLGQGARQAGFANAAGTDNGDEWGWFHFLVGEEMEHS